MAHNDSSQAYYAPEHKWLWDPWFINTNSQIHLFHLQANPTKFPNDRHHNTISIGHAVAKSEDLTSWDTMPTALKSGVQDSWDEAALWTGSILYAKKNHYLFYTGLSNKSSEYWIQRIGVAESSDNDLKTWVKKTNPILEADNHYYAMNNQKNALGVIPAFRDPYAFRYNNDFYLAFTARAVGQPPEYNGCIGLAKSPDLENWEFLPPLFAPQLYDEMEVPQIVFYHEKCYLFFTTAAKYIDQKWAKEFENQIITSCYVADNLNDEFKPVNGNGVVYASKYIRGLRLIEEQVESYVAIGWLDLDVQNRFIGKLSYPLKMYINGLDIKVIR